MANCYSDATHIRNLIIQKDIENINYIIKSTNSNKEIVSKLYTYGTIIQVINSINKWNSIKSLCPNCNNETLFKQYINCWIKEGLISPYAIKDILINT
jgi:hypothetical protein